MECDSANFSQSQNLDFLRNKIVDNISDEYLRGDITLASIYYRDLNNGPWMGINEKELFSPASLIKVPVMLTYFKLAESNPSILDETIKYDPTLIVTQEVQNIHPSVTLAPKKEYTIGELIYNMIVYSDNIAFDLLQEHIDKQLIINTYTDLGIDISKGLTDPTGNIISVRNYASFFRILYNSSYLDKEYSEKALEILSKVDYHDGITKELPKDVTVAHKFGERGYVATGEHQLHDCGIVYVPRKPYLICVMTRGRDLNKLASTVSEISTIVYREISKN